MFNDIFALFRHMFFDHTVIGTALIDRLSGGGKMLRRVVVATTDGCLTLCKTNGAVCRIVHVSQVTHLVHAPDDAGNEAGWVLLRVSKEHDILFCHVLLQEGGPLSMNNGSTGGSRDVTSSSTGHPFTLTFRLSPSRFVELLVSERAKVNGLPLSVAARSDHTILRKAADVAKRPGFIKPKATSNTTQVFTPTVFDDFPVPAASTMTQIATAVDMRVDASFVTMLNRAVVAHPTSASALPLVLVEPGAPFRPVEVSSRFFCAFVAAFDAELPLVIHVQCHLPQFVTFRASRRFWRFVMSRVLVTRPPQTVLAMLSDAYVVVHAEETAGSGGGGGGLSHSPTTRNETDPTAAQYIGPAAAMSATIAEWNDVIMCWDADVRSCASRMIRAGSPSSRHLSTSGASASGRGANTAAAEADHDSHYWRHFVAELSALAKTAAHN